MGTLLDAVDEIDNSSMDSTSVRTSDRLLKVAQATCNLSNIGMNPVSSWERGPSNRIDGMLTCAGPAAIEWLSNMSHAKSMVLVVVPASLVRHMIGDSRATTTSGAKMSISWFRRTRRRMASGKSNSFAVFCSCFAALRAPSSIERVVLLKTRRLICSPSGKCLSTFSSATSP